MDEKEFKKRFYENVLILLQKTCTLLDIKYHVNYLNEEFSTIINVVLFYTGYPKIKHDDQLTEIYTFQMDIAHEKLMEFYKDFVKENFLLTENDNVLFFRYSDLNHNTAIFFSGDNYDGFNFTLTDE